MMSQNVLKLVYYKVLKLSEYISSQRLSLKWLFQLYKMKSEQLLSNVWGVWLSFSSGVKTENSYATDLIKLYELKNWADFAYIWTQSDIRDPNNYFANPSNGQYFKFEIQGDMKKIQSINFFKNSIQPTWEYGDNSKGGYFNFSLLKQTSSEIIQKIYELLVFGSVGDSLSICDSLIGIRVVDTLSKKKFRCRFQIWVDYRESDGNLETIKKHAYEVKQILQKSDINLSDIKFFNIGGKKQPTQKNEHKQ